MVQMKRIKYLIDIRDEKIHVFKIREQADINYDRYGKKCLFPFSRRASMNFIPKNPVYDKRDGDNKNKRRSAPEIIQDAAAESHKVFQVIRDNIINKKEYRKKAEDKKR
jgi:hypothetical protein